jgi:hypothetical protein
MVSSSGLSTTPDEYRRRLGEQPDDRIDAWVAELMRDMSIRRGVRSVLRDFTAAAGVNEAAIERIYAVGGGPPAAVGRTTEGELMVPAISLHYLVRGTRTLIPDARHRLTEYLVNAFHDIVYI